MSAYAGLHPAVGALDVCPLVWLDPADRAAARTEAVEVAGADRRPRRSRLPLRRAGEPPGARRAGLLPQRRPCRALAADGGRRAAPRLRPALPHRTAGVTLVTARPPLAAFNVELDSGDVDARPRRRRRPARVGRRPARRAGDRAGALQRPRPRSRPTSTIRFAVPLAEVVERVRALAQPLGARPLEAEIVGLVPARGPRRLSRRRADPRLRPGRADDRGAPAGRLLRRSGR